MLVGVVKTVTSSTVMLYIVLLGEKNDPFHQQDDLGAWRCIA